jgi:hypothetical protein
MESAFPFVLFLLFAVVAAALAYYQYLAKQERQRAFAAFAATNGLRYFAHDPFDLLAEPFHLFRRGDGRGIENVLDGEWAGVPVRAFDYWYYEESTDSEGHRRKTYSRFDCAITPIEATCVPLRISRESVFSRLADHVALRDLEFELEEFNRAFDVQCEDRKFANDFLDQRMMRWLLAAPGKPIFEVAHDRLLCAVKKVGVEELPVLLHTIRRFREQVPKVVFSLYPRPG